jgi:L-amino acid N-acyltransferase YncA
MSETPAQEPSVNLTTNDGRSVTVRHIHGEDADLLEQMFYKLSPETRWRRFFVPLENIDPEQVKEGAARLANIDPQREAALIALVDGQEGLAAVAVARYASMDEQGMTVESSIVIRDDYQHTGLGKQLLDLLVQTAMARGVHHVVMFTHADNSGMITLARKLGLPYEGKYSAGLYEIDVRLMDEG